MTDIQKKPLKYSDATATYWLEEVGHGPDVAEDLFAVIAHICAGGNEASVELESFDEDRWRVVCKGGGYFEEGIDRAIELLGLEGRGDLQYLMEVSGIVDEAADLALAHAQQLRANDAIGNPITPLLYRHLYYKGLADSKLF